MDERDLDPDPLVAFQAWFREAEGAVPRADAMTLATAAVDGRPSARVVLLRGFDERGFVFFTNRESRKGAELLENPHAALVFHWWELGRQVRIEGDVEEVDSAGSEEYWGTRPRESRIAAWASPQSRPVGARAELNTLYAEANARFLDADIPLPPFWGGYRVVPETYEFWTHRESRLHDRIRYVRSGSAWRQERLAP